MALNFWKGSIGGPVQLVPNGLQEVLWREMNAGEAHSSKTENIV